MKEVRRKKEERGKGRVQSSRGLGRTVVPLVAGLARLVRPLVDTVVVTAGVLAPRGVGRTADMHGPLAVVGARQVIDEARGETTAARRIETGPRRRRYEG